jgi:quinol-cytochrome oxidoreductase complex cytochrome b subunit
MNDEKKEVVAEPEEQESSTEPSGLVHRFKVILDPFIAKGKEDLQAAKDYKRTQLWKSVFRHKLDETPRNRALAVLTNVFLHLHPAKVNRDAVRFRFTWGMGGLSLYLFVVLTVTGVFLMFYFHPTKGQAYQDIMYLHNDVPFGGLLRNMHRWAAHLMIITVWLHMFRVFLTGSYKSPREFNWTVGVICLVLTLLLSFTGYLLPDDQLGFWAVTVGTNMARATPLLGHEGPFGPELGITAYNDVRFALLGGSIVDANALLRAYIWHCIALPLLISIFLAVHFWRVRKDGSISGPSPVMLEKEIKSPRK